MIVFTIPKATPSLNQIKGMNQHVYKRLRQDFFWLVKSQIHRAKGDPIKNCSISITRHGSRMLDWDNCYGGIKPLMDCLVMPTKTNPSGLGLIEDDNPKVVTSLVMYQEKAKRAEEKTVIIIMDLD